MATLILFVLIAMFITFIIVHPGFQLVQKKEFSRQKTKKLKALIPLILLVIYVYFSFFPFVNCPKKYESRFTNERKKGIIFASLPTNTMVPWLRLSINVVKIDINDNIYYEAIYFPGKSILYYYSDRDGLDTGRVLDNRNIS